MERAPRLAVSAVVLDAAGRVLLIERGKPPGEGLWSVPGGRVELGEAVAEAVAREVREETGLEVTVGELVAVVERIRLEEPGGYHYVILDYLAFGREGQVPVAGSDARAARFVALEELAALPLTEGLLAVIERAQRLAIEAGRLPARRACDN